MAGGHIPILNVLLVATLAAWCGPRAVSSQAAALPHVDTCYMCHKCWFTQNRDVDAPPPLSAQIEEREQGPSGAMRIVPPAGDLHARRQLPNCTECWGCSTQLRTLRGGTLLGHTAGAEQGASSEWLFLADLPPGHPAGSQAVVKVWCVPVDKRNGVAHATCSPTHAVASATHLLALDKLTHDCGLGDVTIKVWVARVNAVIPGVGLHIWWHGLWMERAPGLSFNQISYVSAKDLQEKLLLGLLQERLNRTQVIRAAVFDLLTGQCDRHAQNAFLDETGNLKLIDNLNSLRLSWVNCSQDSIFLPGTQKHEIVAYGGAMISKAATARPRRTLNPMVLLDYRCWVPGGAVGTRLPPEVLQCTRKLAGMTPESVQQHYGFARLAQAEMLVQRASDMLIKGFEWALKCGQPTNRGPLRYRWRPPCCHISLDPRRGLQCGHDWDLAAEMPQGDPVKGGPWMFPRVDPGVYDGDTVCDGEQ